MKLEKQLSALRYSRKLKKLGVIQDSLIDWVQLGGVGKWKLLKGYRQKDNNWCSAFTVAELYKLISDKYGKCYIRPNIKPEYLADYLAESYIDKSLPEVL